MSERQQTMQRMVMAGEMRLNAHLILYQSCALMADEVGMKREEKASYEALANLLKMKFHQAILAVPESQVANNKPS